MEEKKKEKGIVIERQYKSVTFRVIPVKSIEEYKKSKKEAKVININFAKKPLTPNS